jgi:hypothetical protein
MALGLNASYLNAFMSLDVWSQISAKILDAFSHPASVILDFI